MKKTILVLFMLVIMNSFSLILAQNESSTVKSNKFEFNVLGGFNSAELKYLDNSLLLEGRYSLSENFGIKLSLGYTSLSDEKNLNVKAYKLVSAGSVDKYETLFYNIEKHKYEIIPVSIGLDYQFRGENYIPYLFLELGYNSYSTKVITGKKYYGIAGTFDSIEEVPSDYRSGIPGFYVGDSFRISLGVGLKIRIPGFLTFNSRYLYQVNTSLINNHAILFGFSF
jgi:hypothetical protein